jgi:NADH/NAD ratio-sensing transcriptional regulator Rex
MVECNPVGRALSSPAAARAVTCCRAISCAGSDRPGVLNFAPGVLRLSAAIPVVNADLTFQMEQLAFQVKSGRAG